MLYEVITGVGVSGLYPGYVKTNLGENTVKIGGDIRQYTASMPESGVTPADVGEMVAKGIADNASHIVTHKGAWQQTEKRFAAIKAACALREGA